MGLRQQQEETQKAVAPKKVVLSQQQDEAKPEKARTRTQKRQAGRKERAEDWQSLAAEERLAKKMRRGRLTGAQFERGLKKALCKLGSEASDASDSLDSSDSCTGKRKAKDQSSVGGSNVRWLTGRKKRRRKGKH